MNKYCSPLVVILLLFSQNAFAEDMSTLQNELKAIREDMKKIESENRKKIIALEEKLSSYEERQLSQETSSQVGDKEKIDYMARKKNVPIGTYLGVMNPDISVVVDTNVFFTDDRSQPERNKIRLREGELALKGNLYPGIRGDFFVAFEQEYEEDGEVTGEVDLEAATISFMDLPLDMTAQVGRMFVEFGDMNKIHQHHLSTVDQPLVFDHFLGEHSWVDDGVQLSALVPNPLDLFWKVEANYLNGNPLGMSHDHEDDEDHGGSLPLQRKMGIFRTFLNIPSQDNSMDLNLSYSFAIQEKEDLRLHGVGAVFKYRIPNSFMALNWKNELIFHRNDASNTEGMGGYSQVKFTWNAYWNVGTRFDWTEFADNNDRHSTAYAGFITYNFTETTFTRVQYRHRDEPDDKHFDEVFLQIVWGIGPHSHRLEN